MGCFTGHAKDATAPSGHLGYTVDVPSTVDGGRQWRSDLRAWQKRKEEAEDTDKWEVRHAPGGRAETQAQQRARRTAERANLQQNEAGLYCCPHCNEPFAANRIWMHARSCALLTQLSVNCPGKQDNNAYVVFKLSTLQYQLPQHLFLKLCLFYDVFEANRLHVKMLRQFFDEFAVNKLLLLALQPGNLHRHLRYRLLHVDHVANPENNVMYQTAATNVKQGFQICQHGGSETQNYRHACASGVVPS